MNTPSFIENDTEDKTENSGNSPAPKVDGDRVHGKIPRRVRSSKKSAAAFRTISEVADTLDVQQHVLRFWETKFSQIRPLKRGGGRRYYRPEDLALLTRIHYLLYTEGYTIKGVQKLLQQHGKKAFVSGEMEKVIAKPENTNSVQAEPLKPAVQQGLHPSQRTALREMLTELKELRQIVEGA